MVGGMEWLVDVADEVGQNPANTTWSAGFIERPPRRVEFGNEVVDSGYIVATMNHVFFAFFAHRARAALRAASLRSAAVRLFAVAAPPDAANFFLSDAESAIIRAVPPLLVSS